MPAFTVRRLNPGDATLYRAIRLDALGTDPDSFGSTYAVEATRPLDAFEHRLATSAVFAAVCASPAGEQAVGMAGFSRDTGPQEGHKGYVWGVFVHPDHRRQGIARDLMAAVLAEADATVELITLSVTMGEPAIALYRRLGFTTYGVLPGSIRRPNGDLDETMMVRIASRRRAHGNSGPGCSAAPAHRPVAAGAHRRAQSDQMAIKREDTMTIAAILKHKGAAVAHTAPTDTVHAVACLLHEKRIGAVLVLDVAGQLLGILSERDIVAFLARHGAATLDMTAAQLMTTGLHTGTRNTTVPEAMALMTERRVRHLPIVEGGNLLGIVSIGDVVKAHNDMQAHEVDSLKAYVAGS